VWGIQGNNLYRSVLDAQKNKLRELVMDISEEGKPTDSIATYSLTEDPNTTNLTLVGAAYGPQGVSTIQPLRFGKVFLEPDPADLGKPAVDQFLNTFLNKYCASCHATGDAAFVAAYPGGFEVEPAALEKHSAEIKR
jgi:hypothetical protein